MIQLRTVLSICCLAPLFCCRSSLAQDRAADTVFYGPAIPRSTNLWNAPPVLTFTGKIDRLDNQLLEIVDMQGERHKLSSDRIERIEVAWQSPAATAAHARFAQRQWVAALKENDEVLRAVGVPRWQQCILLTELVEAAEAIGKIDLSAGLFLKLTQQSPPDFLLATIPLNWTSRELSAPLEKAAREWITQTDEFAILLGASWLLLVDQQASVGRLQKLQASPIKLIQRLAAMQLWRASPPSETTGEMARWYAARDSLSLPMQLGPTEFLAERFARVDKIDLAIGEWLRIAASHPHHPQRAQAALSAAKSRLLRTENKTAAELTALWSSQLSALKLP